MKNKFFTIFLVICGLFLIFTITKYYLNDVETRHAASLPVFGQVSAFSLYNVEEQPFGLTNLQGKTWIANFFFTTCVDICPMMSAHMASLNRSFELEKDVHLVSFTVNPEQDSPQVLLEYAKKFKANTDKWHFLTGSREELTQIAVQSFKLGDVKEPIFHSTYFCLVDGEGRIRGYYEGMKKEGINQLFKDASILLKYKYD